MNVQAQKWGNSLAVRIPKAFAAQTDIREGTALEIRVEGDGIVMRKAQKRLNIEELIAQITPENLHEPVDWGAPVGKEEI